jgi:RNA polymerase sigma-70 factor (ECF subfamily)
MAITTRKTARRGPATSERTPDGILEAAFDEHWTWVCQTLYRLVGDWDEAEDLALDVFCRLHERPPADPERVSGWLYRAATNTGLNALRARKRRRRYEDDAGTLAVERDAPVDPAVWAEQREVQHRVRKVLAGMRPRAAQVLVLRYSGLSYIEIASALDIAPGSVGTMLVRAERAFERRYRALEARHATP